MNDLDTTECPCCNEHAEDCSCTQCMEESCDKITRKGLCSDCAAKLKTERDRFEAALTEIFAVWCSMATVTEYRKGIPYHRLFKDYMEMFRIANDALGKEES